MRKQGRRDGRRPRTAHNCRAAKFNSSNYDTVGSQVQTVESCTPPERRRGTVKLSIPMPVRPKAQGALRHPKHNETVARQRIFVNGTTVSILGRHWRFAGTWHGGERSTTAPLVRSRCAFFFAASSVRLPTSEPDTQPPPYNLVTVPNL